MALVLDASALVEMAMRSATGAAVRGYVARDRDVHVPVHAELEATAALAGIERRGDISRSRADAAFLRLRRLRAAYAPIDPFLPRVWSMRHNVKSYDAAYFALAEALRATFLTADARLARAAEHSGVRCEVVQV